MATKGEAAAMFGRMTSPQLKKIIQLAETELNKRSPDDIGGMDESQFRKYTEGQIRKAEREKSDSAKREKSDSAAKDKAESAAREADLRALLIGKPAPNYD